MLFEPRLCYITDRNSLAPQPLIPRLEAAVRAGVELIQLREKDLPTRGLSELARAAVRAAVGSESRIVINDRLDIAMVVGTHGVHLGVQSMPPGVIRSHVGNDFLIGASCHSLEEALKAEAGGASYLLFGPIFDTPSKRRYGPPLGLESLSRVAERTRIPVLALGGITVERVRSCLDAGAIGVAGIRLFQDCPSVENRVKELRARFA